MPIDFDSTETYLQSNDWQKLFTASALASGKKLAHTRSVHEASATLLDTGDLELSAYVMEKNGHQHETNLYLWLENAIPQLDTDCSCAQKVTCPHASALLYHLARPNRLEKAFGQVIGTTPQKNILPTDEHVPPADVRKQVQAIKPADVRKQVQAIKPAGDQREVQAYLLRLERKPSGDQYAWLPNHYAHAYAIYPHGTYPLEPSGILPPNRSRSEEMQALKLLYALDLQPGAENHTPQLKKVARPPHKSTLWIPDKQEWSHADFYWQRFIHQAIPALEKRGFKVQISPHFGLKPLIFRSESWRADIVDEGKGWFHLSAGFEIDGEDFELQPILAALLDNHFSELTKDMPEGQEFLIFLPDGRGLALPVGRFRHILKTLGELLDYQFDPDKPIRLQKTDAALVSEALNNDEIPISSPPELAKLTSQHPIAAVAVPTGLRATLRNYQLDGFYWMQHLARHGLHGILADDMGLGKTMQTLTHLLSERETGRASAPSLVIAPTSVVSNWQREAAKFAPSLRVLILQGAHRHDDFGRIHEHDLILTSYALIHRDLEQFSQHSFHLLILDEAQHIKNSDTQVAQAVKQFTARHKLALSGTPIENHLGELWSLFSFLMPELLGSQEQFNLHYRNPIEREKSTEKLQLLEQRLGHLILRRTKQSVAKELPPKTEIPHLIRFNNDQKDLYETVRSTMDKKVRQAFAMRGKEAKIVFLDALLKLRQICCHPRLLHDSQHAEKSSAKFDYLCELLANLRSENHRVLIFSQFTSMLALIETHLNDTGISYLKLTGKSKSRQELVERFQSGEGEVFLISLKAGGTGLTLTGADTVIHYDPWWNPAVQDQATDRAYRIGQDKAVMVHKLICEDTVEQRILQMQGKKSTLSDNILNAALQSIQLDTETAAELLS